MASGIKPKTVRSIKGETPKGDSNQIQVIPGNIPALSIQLLNSINQSLITLVKLAKENNG